jgi:hypothetical protein
MCPLLPDKPGGMNLWPRHFARINVSLNLKVGVGLNRAGGSSRCYTRGEVEPGKAKRHLSEADGANRIEHMLVHSDDARDDGVSRQVESFRVR